MHAHDLCQSSAVKKLKSKIDWVVYKKGTFPFRFTTITRKDSIIMETAAGKADKRMALITLRFGNALDKNIYSPSASLDSKLSS